MVKNYLKIVLRNLYRHKSYSFINITGLAVGLACCLLIMLYVRDDLSYDTFHEHGEDIYRVSRNVGPNTPGPLGPTLINDFPEVMQATRLMRSGSLLLSYEDQRFYESRFFFADANLFEVFTFPFVQGIPETALSTPNTVVLTQEMARKYFGEEDPMSKVVTIGNWGDFEVTGILEAVPQQSHFTFDFLLSFETIVARGAGFLENWQINPWLYTYVRLQPGTDITGVEAKLPGLIERYMSDYNFPMEFLITPLHRIYLHSTYSDEIGQLGNSANVYVFSAIAFFILLLACINFMNLATARSLQRAKEVGLRKVVGARRGQLVQQFLGESLVVSFLGLGVALALVWLFLPYFNDLVGKTLSLALLDQVYFWAMLVGLGGLVGVLAGSYPAFALSRFKPALVLKGNFATGAQGSWLRRTLVVFQFAITIMLLVGTGIVYNQLDYVRNADLGFDKEQLVVIPMRDTETQRQFEAIRSELIQNPNVVGVTATSTVPGRSTGDYFYAYEGMNEEDEQPSLDTYFVAPNFLEVMRIEVVSGRGFSKEIPTDRNAFIVNEAVIRDAQSRLGAQWHAPLGKQLDFYRPGGEGWTLAKTGPLIGVIKDFHYTSLHSQISPMALQVVDGPLGNMMVRIRPDAISATLKDLQHQMAVFAPKSPFDYFFLDEDFDRLYRTEQQLGQIFTIFAALAILIASLGLFGLASYTTAQRTKEIGVRKVLGASVWGIVMMLSKDFTRLVAVSVFMACPIAYFAMNQWLQNFAYRTDIGVGIFVLTGGLALGIALATVSYQVIRAALSAPVKALRCD